MVCAFLWTYLGINPYWIGSWLHSLLREMPRSGCRSCPQMGLRNSPNRQGRNKRFSLAYRARSLLCFGGSLPSCNSCAWSLFISKNTFSFSARIWTTTPAFYLVSWTAAPLTLKFSTPKLGGGWNGITSSFCSFCPVEPTLGALFFFVVGCDKNHCFGIIVSLFALKPLFAAEKSYFS